MGSPSQVPARVFLVDDSAAFRGAFKDLLLAQGVSVVGEAGSGEAAVDRAAELHPDIAFVDARMEGIGGIEACRRIHVHSQNTHLVLISASLRDIPETYWQSGVSTVLSKDAVLEPGRVRALIDELMRATS